MKIRRLYNSEEKFLFLRALLIFTVIAAAGIFVFAKTNTTFKDYLVEADTKRLYEYIEKPDFSYDIFCAYMKYNYGGSIEVLDVFKNKNSIRYRVKANNGEKSISLVKKNGRYYWLFDDYVYNWKIKLLKNAVIKIEKMPVKNIDGIASIESIPFGLYEIYIESNVSEPYRAKILAGQNIEIKLNPSYQSIKKGEESIVNFLEFKEAALKNKKIKETNSIVKETGVYREVMDEIEWEKSNDYNILKDLKSYSINESVMDASGLIYIDVEESWEITVKNDGKSEKRAEVLNNTYIINPDLEYTIEGIITN